MKLKTYLHLSKVFLEMMMKRDIYTYLIVFFMTVLLSLTGCTDDLVNHDGTGGKKVNTVEGLEGTLSLRLGSDDFDSKVSILTRAGDSDDEQTLYSVYVFIVDMKNEESGDASCPVIARKYFPDVTDSLSSVTENGVVYEVVDLEMKAISSNEVEIFAVANLGYCEKQHISNDGAMLSAFDQANNLAELKAISASQQLTDGNVNVERMQGHHLMSGYYADFSDEDNLNYLQTDKKHFALVKETGVDNLSIYDSDDNTRLYRPLGGSGSAIPGAVIVHRLDSKVKFIVKPSEALSNIDGAYFHLKTWQVMNMPVSESVRWIEHGDTYSSVVANSKVYADVTENEDSWSFIFYQFENFSSQAADVNNGYILVDANEIASQYNMEYSLSGSGAVSSSDVTSAFSSYPNSFSNYAYTLRDRNEKVGYNIGTDDDQTVSVTNGAFDHAPASATYIILKGDYFNPGEPLRRRADDVKNNNFPAYSLAAYPYWSDDGIPVATAAEAAVVTRAANVTYYIHLGYVGGGNSDRTIDGDPTSIASFSDFKGKVNDYNVLRNNYYTYTITVAGVNNIKVEATRENGGNIYEQENQTGAEGVVVESHHFFELDSHYETRNITIDFKHMPDSCDGYGFIVSTPYNNLAVAIRQESDGTYKAYNVADNSIITDIPGADCDWVHFAWHGTEENPSRSLINADTQNGISYSNTYGGYTIQRSYNDPDGILTHEQDSDHPYYLMNVYEFTRQIWYAYLDWVAAGKPEASRTRTYTMYVDEYYYDNNPITGANVDWMSFCNKEARKLFLFTQKREYSADNNSRYTDSHIVIEQHSIQTPYATSSEGGQSIADVAFGIEYLDEFQAKYAVTSSYEAQNFLSSSSSYDNGLYNTMVWYRNNISSSTVVIPWTTAEGYYTEAARAYTPTYSAGDYSGNSNPNNLGRANRLGGWAIYSRNRDLDRDGVLDANEIRWFAPATNQYIICFLGGDAVFENPIYEASKAIEYGSHEVSWLEGVPVLHYLLNGGSQILWAEEGCSLGGYTATGAERGCVGIRMARMFCQSGMEDTGEAFGTSPSENELKQDGIYIVSSEHNGPAISDYSGLADGNNYYITFNKLNANAFRDYVASGDLSQHTHEEKNDRLYREIKIAQNKIGYTSFTAYNDYDRTPAIDGVSQTWWRMNGVWTILGGTSGGFYYDGPKVSMAYNYAEAGDRSDLHLWRIPNLREGAVMSMVFPNSWFGDSYISTRTRAGNLGASSTNVPYWNIKANVIGRNSGSTVTNQFVRPVYDIE